MIGPKSGSACAFGATAASVAATELSFHGHVLPTAVGIAWTDGVRLIHFSAVDGNGNSLGQIDDNTCCDFNSGDGNSANYRLFYAIDPLGISSIHISNDGGGIEVDHLQYGLLAPTAVPEPSTIAFTLFTAGVLLTHAARRRIRS